MVQIRGKVLSTRKSYPTVVTARHTTHNGICANYYRDEAHNFNSISYWLKVASEQGRGYESQSSLGHYLIALELVPLT